MRAKLARIRFAIVPSIAVLWQLRRMWWRPDYSRLDFHIYYQAVAAAGRDQLYSFKDPFLRLGFTYPPFAAMVLRPLTVFSALTAEKLWLLASLAMAVAFAVVCARELPGPTAPWRRSFACAFFLVAMPVSLTLRLGQINALIALLIAIEAMLMARRANEAGVCLGVATAIKLTPGFVIAVLAMSRRWREARTALVTAAVCTLVAALFFLRDSRTYFSDVLFDTHRVGDVGSQFNNSLRRPIAWLHTNQRLETIIWVVASLAVLAIATWRARAAFREGNALAALTVGTIGSYLVSPISWSHHLMFLAPGVALLAFGRREWWRWAIVIPGAIVTLDPVEGGEGYAYSTWRIVLMIVLVVVPLTSTRAAGQPRDSRAARVSRALRTSRARRNARAASDTLTS